MREKRIVYTQYVLFLIENSLGLPLVIIGIYFRMGLIRLEVDSNFVHFPKNHRTIHFGMDHFLESCVQCSN